MFWKKLSLEKEKNYDAGAGHSMSGPCPPPPPQNDRDGPVRDEFVTSFMICGFFSGIQHSTAFSSLLHAMGGVQGKKLYHGSIVVIVALPTPFRFVRWKGENITPLFLSWWLLLLFI